MDKILNRIFRKYNKHGLKIQYRHFTELWIRKMLGNKTFKVDSSNICTTGQVNGAERLFWHVAHMGQGSL